MASFNSLSMFIVSALKSLSAKTNIWAHSQMFPLTQMFSLCVCVWLLTHMEAREGSQVPCFLTFNFISLRLDLSLNLELGMDPVVPRDPLVSDPYSYTTCWCYKQAWLCLAFYRVLGTWAASVLSTESSPQSWYWLHFFPEYQSPIYTRVCI